MSAESAITWTTYLILITLTLQLSELFLISQKGAFKNIWNYQNLYADLESGLPLPTSWIRFLFTDRMFIRIVLFYGSLVSISFFMPNLYFFIAMLICQIYICIRFRGTFNGGSDMMTLVLLTGMILIHLLGARIGLIYISVHTLYSYFKAGIVKAKHREWWDGNALPIFLQRSLYSHSQKISIWLSKNKTISRLAGIATVAFELSAVALLFFPNLVWPYFIGAFIFHLIVFYTFGLNRFFWAWLSAWPATLFSISLLGGK